MILFIYLHISLSACRWTVNNFLCRSCCWQRFCYVFLLLNHCLFQGEKWKEILKIDIWGLWGWFILTIGWENVFMVSFFHLNWQEKYSSFPEFPFDDNQQVIFFLSPVEIDWPTKCSRRGDKKLKNCCRETLSKRLVTNITQCGSLEYPNNLFHQNNEMTEIHLSLSGEKWKQCRNVRVCRGTFLTFISWEIMEFYCIKKK